MKKLLIVLSIILLVVSCAGLQVSDGLFKDPLEIEGNELGTFEAVAGISFDEIKEFEFTRTEKLNPLFVSGLPQHFQYVADWYKVSGVEYWSLIYTLKDGKRIRLERAGNFYFDFRMMGWLPGIIFDRYANSDSWYIWDLLEFEAQHAPKQSQEKPEADPNRFKRHDACMDGADIKPSWA